MIINNKIRHDQHCLPNLTGLQATAICFYMQNHRLLLFVSAYLPPISILPLSDLDSIFTQHDSVILVVDLNSKHAAWHNTSGNRNGRILLSYCVNKNITLNCPDQPTHFPHNSTPSVLDITLPKQCPTFKPQAVPTLSSDYNLIVFKILHPWPRARRHHIRNVDPTSRSFLHPNSNRQEKPPHSPTHARYVSY